MAKIKIGNMALTNQAINFDDPDVRHAMTRHLLLQLFNGWQIRNASWVPNPDYNDNPLLSPGSYGKDPITAMIEACGGDEKYGFLIHLFDYWANDIMSIAPHYGVAYVPNGERKSVIYTDVPPAPSPQHWWYEGEWVEPSPDPTNTPVYHDGSEEQTDV